MHCTAAKTLQVKAAVSARASSWKDSRQPSVAGRHHGYIPPRSVVVTAHQQDVHATTTANKTTGAVGVTV